MGRLKNSKTPEEALDDSEAIVTLPKSTKVKLHEQKVLALLEKRNKIRQQAKNVNAEMRDAYDNAENDGIGKKELKATIESILHPVSDSHKFLVNHLRQALGQPSLFDAPAGMKGDEEEDESEAA